MLFTNKDVTAELPSVVFQNVSEQQEENNHNEEVNYENAENRGRDIDAAEFDHQNEGEINSMEIEMQNEGEADFPPRTRKTPAYLGDYYCHAAHKNPMSMAPTHSHFSGKVYPITNFINIDCYSRRHRVYLASIHTHR